MLLICFASRQTLYSKICHSVVLSEWNLLHCYLQKEHQMKMLLKREKHYTAKTASNSLELPSFKLPIIWSKQVVVLNNCGSSNNSCVVLPLAESSLEHQQQQQQPENGKLMINNDQNSDKSDDGEMKDLAVATSSKQHWHQQHSNASNQTSVLHIFFIQQCLHLYILLLILFLIT